MRNNFAFLNKFTPIAVQPYIEASLIKDCDFILFIVVVEKQDFKIEKRLNTICIQTFMSL